ncbi:hypothetical protein CSKR_103650 [Clonorchis sinensis]|uniref:Uncharacterized protein n=1 Tax=Clonorchis sinensis TaxID=79923 RepID=A0A419PKM2_CLOSI|nr:hypothetical protein CSKR_103650 [Clonorchis sinensis]
MFGHFQSYGKTLRREEELCYGQIPIEQLHGTLRGTNYAEAIDQIARIAASNSFRYLQIRPQVKSAVRGRRSSSMPTTCPNELFHKAATQHDCMCLVPNGAISCAFRSDCDWMLQIRSLSLLQILTK